MNKRHLHHLYTKTRWLKPRYILILTLLSTLFCLMALRANNEHMLKLRNDVYAADKAGTDVIKPLDQLQAYVTRHMNTNLADGPNAVYPPIQLQYTYQRLVEAQGSQLATTNSQLYSQAQAYCEKQDPVDFSGHNRVPCIEQYVLGHSSITLPQIPDSLYKFSFVSPVWSPDLAGWSLLATIILALLFVVSLLANWWLKRRVTKV